LSGAVVALAGVLVFVAHASEDADGAAAPIFGVTLPAGFRDWKVISVAHDIAIRAYREGKLPYPDGTIIVRLAWSYVSSEENDKVLGPQSFVTGSPINVQLDVKDSKKYASSGGWGFAEFKDGKPADKAVHETCLPCHQLNKAGDFVFTHYAPTP
jgi:hypothetical protein